MARPVIDSLVRSARVVAEYQKNKLVYDQIYCKDENIALVIPN